jgi:hypothetical protein
MPAFEKKKRNETCHGFLELLWKLVNLFTTSGGALLVLGPNLSLVLWAYYKAHDVRRTLGLVMG